MWNKIWTYIRHNQFFFSAVVICLFLVVWGFGCEVTTTSPSNSGVKVTRSELDIEVEALAAKVENAYEDLSRKEAIRNAILEAGLAYASGQGVNPLGLASTLAGICGIGLAADNRRKDAIIKSKTNALNQIKENTTV